MSTFDAQAILSALSAEVEKSFSDNLTILTYAEWLELVLADPAKNLRSAAQYIRDVFDHYGRETRDLPQGPVQRFRLFDAPWSNGDGRVAGQEQVQQEIYRLVSNFVRDGRVSRLILLHGPNGSAKSTLIRCIQSAMEHYSTTPAGALYSYSWVFPSEKLAKGGLGFGSDRSKKTSAGDSFARLGAEEIDARLPCELRDHPIFFIPREQRVALIARLKAAKKLPEDFVVSRYILEGDLSPRDRALYDALLVAYDGRHEQVLRHVEVHRFYISGKYGRGVATVDPQDAVDAHAEQLTADRSILNLPRTVQNVPMHRLWGPLISANRGNLEYADILKRPIEWLKYLLTTSEEATASLPQFKIHLDELLVASTNEIYLEAFKKSPDWNSFKGRIELVAVPYLRRFSDEVRIYESQVRPDRVDKPMAPHVVEAAAMWAVLSRLKKPDKGRYSGNLRGLIDRLTPLEKLKLYDRAEVPSWCTTQEAKELRRSIGSLLDDYKNSAEYEGHKGASARELRTLLLNAAHHPNYRTLTPLSVFAELRTLVEHPTVYDFLQIQSQDGFHDHEGFIDTVHGWWLDTLDTEVRSSMGLVEETRYDELFAKYVVNVSAYLKKERIHDKVTGAYQTPDEDFMREIELAVLPDGEKRDDFRRAVIGQIGAWGLEHAGQTPDYRRLFPSYVEKLESDFYKERAKVIRKNLVSVLKYLGDGEKELEEADLEVARSTVKAMETRYRYPRECTAECVAHLLRERYSESS